MATSTESNPPSRDASDQPARSKDPPRTSGASPGVSELNLEKSVIRRGSGHPAGGRGLQGAPDQARGQGRLQGACWRSWSRPRSSPRPVGPLLKEVGGETAKKFEIPGYEIIEKLGKGSMGLVFKARQTSVDRIVAVKVLLDSLAQNKEFIKRFQREAKIAAKLQHNNIVNAIDAGEVEGHHYFVMEYVEGATIKDELDKSKVFDEKVALKIVVAVAEAMKHAHERGLIHRDIKPENVILTKDGQVKLADLGLARLTADEKWAMSEAGMAIGTPYYISPEQVRGQVDVDIRGDIYSLGATLYHMVTGRGPLPGRDPAEVMRKHVDKNASQLDPARPRQHPALQRAGRGRRDDDGQEPRQPLPEPRRPDPGPQVPAPGRERR